MLFNEKITECVYRILNAGCDVYLVDGKIPYLIDCGCSKDNIKEYVESLIHKPVNHVLITHAHIDHCGHAGLFEQVYMTKETALQAKNWMDENPECLQLNYDYIQIEDGLKLVIGDSVIEVIYCDIHCNGNVMFLDHAQRFLFTGDEIDQDQVLLLPSFATKKGEIHSKPAASVKEYRDMLKRIWNRKDQFDMLCTGHNGSPLKKDTILSMIECCDAILKGEKGQSNLSSNSYTPEYTHYPYEHAHYRRFEKNGMALVYCSDDLIDSKYNSQVIPATPLHLICKENFD